MTIEGNHFSHSFTLTCSLNDLSGSPICIVNKKPPDSTNITSKNCARSDDGKASLTPEARRAVTFGVTLTPEAAKAVKFGDTAVVKFGNDAVMFVFITALTFGIETIEDVALDTAERFGVSAFVNIPMK
jgi:hypothetical protein